MKKYFLVLGNGSAAKKISKLIFRNYSGYIPLRLTYSNRLRNEKYLLEIKKDKEIDGIKEFVGIVGVVGVVNRFDSYIPLYGKIVDEFGLFGPSFESVMYFKDKSRMHELMERNDLEKYRPKTKIVDFENLEKVLGEIKFPIVAKPFMGAKSRGVFVVRGKEDFFRVLKRMSRHFMSKKIRRVMKNENKVMIEEYIKGVQFTFTGFVDDEGNLHKVGYERIYVGVDVGQKHQQLVYRTTDTSISNGVLQEAYILLNKLVEISGLKSTFIFPDFILTEDKRLILIELNVRIGGFRDEMYQYSSGVDLNEMAIKLALNKKVLVNKRFQKSCTAVEVWTEKTGIIRKFDFPSTIQVRNYKQYFSVGDKYIAPPIGDLPLAKFFVVEEKDSIEKARKLVKKIKLEIK